MLHDLKGNKEFVEYFFKNHKLFFCDDLPWQFFNYENGKKPNSNNLQVRLEYLFGEYGFFNFTVMEVNDKSLFGDTTDFSFWHRNRRYIIQEFIRNGFNNPTHHSIKPNDDTINIDLKNPTDSFGKFRIISHPGNTRFYASSFLQLNLNKCFVYVNKKNYHSNLFTQPLKEITDINDVYQYWKPAFEGVDFSNLRYSFIIHLSPEVAKEKGLVKSTKYHNLTECSILKLWKLWDISRDTTKYKTQNVLHTHTYMQQVNENGSHISDTVMEAPLTIYTNSSEDVKKYFQDIRDDLIKKAKLYMRITRNKPTKNKFQFHNLSKFKVKVKYCDTKPTNFTKENNYKGFAIWIDKNKLHQTNRDIFEFLAFTKKNVKYASTEDKLLSVINCREGNGDTWVINDSFLKCDVSVPGV